MKEWQRRGRQKRATGIGALFQVGQANPQYDEKPHGLPAQSTLAPVHSCAPEGLADRDARIEKTSRSNSKAV
jgi:hypothetical protein